MRAFIEIVPESVRNMANHNNKKKRPSIYMRNAECFSVSVFGQFFLQKSILFNLFSVRQ